MTQFPYRHIHICGPPRSGTTLLVEMMRNCYQWDWAPDEEVTYRQLANTPGGYCLTKKPGGGKFARALLSHPSIWLIYCQRDPRDLICSTHGKAPDLFFAGLNLWGRFRKPFQRVRSHPRLIRVRYEDLVSDPDAIQRTLQDHMDWLEPIADFSVYHERAQPSQQFMLAIKTLRPPDVASIGRWRQHLPRVAGQLALHGEIQKELEEDGYEKDAAWLKELEGVAPDFSPSFHSDRPAAWPTVKQSIRSTAIISALWASILRRRVLRR